MAAENITALSMSHNTAVLPYEPEKEVFHSLTIGDSDNIETYLEGDLAPYATLIDPAQNTGPRTITVMIKLPEGLSSGRHILFVGAREAPSEGAKVEGVSFRVQTRAAIKFDVPYPGVYIEATIKAQDINIGEKETFVVNVANKGLENASKASARVEVLDAGNNTVTELGSSESRAVGAVSDTNFEFEWDSSGTKPGVYKAVATVSSDGNEVKTKEASFKIGALNVDIKDYSKEFVAGTISPFFIEVESGWNEKIQGVYGEIIVANNSFRTLTFDLASWQKIKLTGYVDAKEIAEGEYDGNVVVHYADKNAEKSGKITVKAAGAVREMPAGTEKAGLGAGTIVIMVLGIVFVTAMVVLVIVYAKRRQVVV